MNRLICLPILLLSAGCARPLPTPAEPRDKDGFTRAERHAADLGAQWQRGQFLHVLRARRNVLRQQEGRSHAEAALSDAISALDAP